MINIILFITFCFPLHIETYNISFDRSVVEFDTIIDSYSGDLFSNKEFLFVDINFPINQNFIIRGSKTILYYPDEGKAISISTDSYPVVPFFYTLKAFSIEDFGLSKKGYILDSTQVSSDNKSIISYWTPPKEQSEYINKLELLIKQNNIVSLKSFNERNDMISSIQFYKINEYNKIFLPSEIKFTNRNAIGRVTTETIIINKMIINAPLPKEIMDFKLPDNIEIKEVEW